jgi:uncharacterized membrane protein YphA (DoxX/SURF4 family)
MRALRPAAGILIGGVWIFHGLFSKILDGIPRHRQIVGRILGDDLADPATTAIGVMEILLGCWVLTGRHRRLCAAVQTLGIFTMNFLEILLARQLLISAAGMVALNLCFIALIWWWAAQGRPPTCRNAHTAKSAASASHTSENPQ